MAGADGLPQRVVVDLAGLTFIDSSGINALVELARAVRSTGGAVVFAREQPQVQRVLDIVELGEVVVREPTLESALARLTEAGKESGPAS
jgi:anti-anti-sigma factor